MGFPTLPLSTVAELKAQLALTVGRMSQPIPGRAIILNLSGSFGARSVAYSTATQFRDV
jgi:hypothetical protein